MPQAIKQFRGLHGTSTTSTIYTCPANTIAIVLPNILVTPQGQGGGHGTIGYNSSSVCSSSSSNKTGNYSITNGEPGYQYQITHDNPYGVKIAIGPHNNSTTQVYYSPSFTTNVHNNLYAMRTLNSYYGSTVTTQAGLVAGDGMYRGPSVNYTLTPNDFWAGTWAMSAGHKLTMSTQYQLYFQYSFLIIEEAT